MSEKKQFEQLSLGDKNELKKLLEEFSFQIKSKEEVSGINTNVDEKINSLSLKIEELETKQDAENLLSDLEKELAVLKEYNEFKELLAKLENKLEFEKRKYLDPYKEELASFQKTIIGNQKLSGSEIKELAKEGRKQAAKQIQEGIVAKLAKRDDWIGKLARKALD